MEGTGTWAIVPYLILQLDGNECKYLDFKQTIMLFILIKNLQFKSDRKQF